MLGDRGLDLPGVRYERATRVPLIVKVPAPAQGSRRAPVQGTETALVSHVDLVPTLLELAGLPLPPAGLQGVSFAPLLLAGQTEDAPGVHVRPQPPRTRCFAERSTRMVRTERYKLIETLEDGRYELYDLDADPTERRDLGSDTAWAELVRELARELRDWRAQRPEPVSVRGMALPAYAVLTAAERERHRIQRSPSSEDD
jgi:arylsulfatase A-like enzyme